jgi:dTDP-4-amino-4,6-dideoxygalactose transaminase
LSADPNEKPIFVTQPDLPPLDQFLPYLEQIWEKKWLTNAGEFHNRFESELARYLGVEQLALVSNGTLGLVIGLQALGITGEVITTPYSFVATAHSLLWNNLEPVFVDIDPATCNLDPDKIEAAITPRTTAILPVHCYGMPCDLDRIQQIADKYGLKVIYDAAHAFGVRVDNSSILDRGGLSILSFHATKVFNTFEGGAIVCPNAEMKQHINHLKNFGFVDEVTVAEAGINGKMNEFQASLGLLQLGYVDAAIARRKEIAATYRHALRDVRGIALLPDPVNVQQNFSYFPIFVGPQYPISRDALYSKLRERGIYSRRYFYPLISSMPMYRNFPSSDPANIPIATRIAEEVLCLPIYPQLLDADMARIIDVVRSTET